MAGTIICDFIRTDANQLSLNVGNTTFATINAMGLLSNTGTTIIAANGVISTAAIADASITNAKLSLSANDSNIKTALNASGNPGIYACRAWVNFNGTGTVAIRASGNVSSITDNGVGLYTVNFTTAMSDANYTAVAGVGVLNNTSEFQSQCNVNGPYATTSVQLATGYIASTSEALQDKSVIQIAIFR